MAVTAFFPDEPLAMWHAIFISDGDSPAYSAAVEYGKSLVNLGLAKEYVVFSRGVGEMHVVPSDGGGIPRGYWNYIFDNNL